MNNEIKPWADWAVSQGWTVTDSTQGYTHFYRPDGTWVARYPNTPGNAYRRMKDLKVALRKHGLQIPPPSKKEQRAMRRKQEGK